MSDWMKWLLLGLLSVFFGILVLGNAAIATMAITTLTGAMLLAAGGFQIAGGVSTAGSTGSRILGILIGLLMGFLGVNFLFNPLEGAISLTLLVMLLLAASGTLRTLFSWRMRETAFFWPMLLSGALSLLLAGYIFANFAAATLTLLGVMLGIELLLNGTGLMIFAFAMRRHGHA